jgi:hypothetical protein
MSAFGINPHPTNADPAKDENASNRAEQTDDQIQHSYDQRANELAARSGSSHQRS